MTARTPIASTVHEPIGNPAGPGLWHMKGRELPPYIQHLAHHLIGIHGESRGIAMAVGIVRDWAEGHDGHGNNVHPDVQAAAAKNIADWEKLRAQAHASSGTRRSVVTVTRAEMSTQDINDLPDDKFAYIEPGGKKDGAGKTVPRSLRHFPIHDKAHADNAAARIAQGAEFGKQALPKVKAAQKKFGEDSDGDSDSSASRGQRPELFRTYALEDAHVVRTADGDGSGRVVEAYCAVFDEAAEIKDQQGHYIEEIDRTAFNKRIEDVRRSKTGFSLVKCMYNHGMTIHGTPSERFSMPCAVTEHISAEGRGLLTRARYLDTPLGNEVLEMWRSGAITAQSFTGSIVRSSPDLRRGEKYRPYRGELPRVRRMELGLREFGGTPFPAYSGAELVGVRMSPVGTWQAAGGEYDEQALPPDVEAAAGEPLTPEQEVEHSARYHQHELYRLRSQKQREEIGLVW